MLLCLESQKILLAIHIWSPSYYIPAFSAYFPLCHRYHWAIHILCTTNPEDFNWKPRIIAIFFVVGFIVAANNTEIIFITKEGCLIQIQLKLMSKNNNNITKWFCLPQILPLRLNHHVPKVLLWHIHMWSFCCSCLRWKRPSKPFQICQPFQLNELVQVILCLNKRLCLALIWYDRYHLIPWHPKVWFVSLNNTTLHIIYLPFW